MRDGRIVETGTPQDLYYRPTRLFTAQFIGQTVLLPCKVLRRSHGTADVQTCFPDWCWVRMRLRRPPTPATRPGC
jgi:ABC-type Fe3+/spermidine/putrescine transport system ATPase subunit